MITKLIEFPNDQGDQLRGILTLPTGKVEKTNICIHGFERCTSTEKKFKSIAESSTHHMIATFRFDFTGCGLSDGDFRYSTIKKQASEFVQAINTIQKEVGQGPINIISHSLGACILAEKIQEIELNISKILLIAPALNQKELLRYRFTSSFMKKKDPTVTITRDNYKDYIDEDAFLADCKKESKMSKRNYIDPGYFIEAKETDYSYIFSNFQEKILHIHGDKDIAVPIASNNIQFSNKIIVNGGDHDMEKPDQHTQWFTKAVDFLSI